MEMEGPFKDVLIRAGKDLVQMFTPIGLAKGLIRVCRGVFNMKKINELYYCTKCRLYVVPCPHCEKNGYIHSKIPDIGSYRCISCGKSFYYTENDISNDDNSDIYIVNM